jgi:thioesterase domain-containing protein
MADTEKMSLPFGRDVLRRARGSEGQVLPSRPPLLVAFRSTGARTPLFLVHGATGWLFVQPESLARAGEDQPMYGFQAAGLDRARMRRNTIREMARRYVCAMREVQPEGPYFIGSPCIGFLVAIEMAIQLRSAGELVGPLLLVDPRPAGQIDALVLPWWGRYRRLIRLYRRKFTAWSPWHERKRRQLEAECGEELRRQNPSGYEQNLRAMVKASLDFKIALLKHTRWRYDGAALILVSARRKDKRRDHEKGAFGGRLTGDLRWFEAGASHGEVVRATTELSAGQFRRCIEIAQAEIARLRPQQGAASSGNSVQA